jgi:HEAT repeat protein
MRAILFVFLFGVVTIRPAPAINPGPDREPPVRRLIEQLKDPDPLRRQDAADALGALGPRADEAIPALIEALNDKAARGPAVHALARIGSKAVQPLISARRDHKLELGPSYQASHDALARLGAKAVPAVIALLNENDCRSWAIPLLADIGPEAEAAIPALAEILKTAEWTLEINWKRDGQPSLLRPEVVRLPSVDNRWKAAMALARIGPKAVTELVKNLESSDEHTPRLAVEALYEMEVPPRAAADALVGTLKDRDRDIRFRAVWTLIKIGGKSKHLVPVLIKELDTPVPGHRTQAAQGLLEVGPDARTAIPALLTALQDKKFPGEEWEFARFRHAQVREIAALRAIGGDAEDRIVKELVPVLIENVSDKNDDVRRDAIFVLSVLGRSARAALPTLIECLELADESSGWIRDALRGIGPESVPPLLDLAKNPDPRVRKRAVEALGEFHGSSSAPIPILIEALSDKDEEVRREAAVSLGQFGPKAKKALPALTRALKDANKAVAVDAARALVLIGADPKEPIALLALCLHDTHDFNWVLGLMALRELGPKARGAVPDLLTFVKSGDKMYRPVAFGILDSVGPVPKSQLPRLLNLLMEKDTDYPEILSLLGHMGSEAKEAVPALIGFLRAHASDANRCRFTLRALGQIGPGAAAAAPVIREQLQDERCTIHATEALGGIGPAARSAVADLAVLLRDYDPACRKAAAIALGRIGRDAEAALPLLRSALRDDDKEVRPAAAKALARIAGK